MTPFEAINHAMSTVATGGYSTSDDLIGHFQSHFINWVAIVFMILGGVPFTILIQAGKGSLRPFFADLQIQTFLCLLVGVSLFLAAWLVFWGHKEPFDALTHSTFSVVSIVTGTGFASADYLQWGGGTGCLFCSDVYRGMYRVDDRGS